MPTAAKRQAALAKTAGSTGTARSPTMGQQFPRGQAPDNGGGANWRRSITNDQWGQLKGFDAQGLLYYQAMRNNGIAHQQALEVCQDAQVQSRFGSLVNA